MCRPLWVRCFFTDAHLSAVRDAIAACFDSYELKVKPELTWLFREDPPEGPSKQSVAKAKRLDAMLAAMDEDDGLSFHYTSGQQEHDAGPWEFRVTGLPAWQASMGDWGLCGLRFAVPLLFVEEQPSTFVNLFVEFARRLRAVHGYAGHGLVLSALRDMENQAFEAFLTSKLRGFDAGSLIAGATNAHQGIKTVGWLTAISHGYLEKIGGESTLRSELPMDWFGLHGYGDGVVIQAGPRPEPAPADAPLPALLVLPNMLLQRIRTPEVGLHYASANSESRLIGRAATEWLQRLDVPAEQIMAFKAKLLDEPRLTAHR
ncbi:type VI immunity family protein [Massilia sp. YIM B02443]|uniref:type VI immunity family protein n=1 Tax=Massilia sp. YIM B02443 TaxID=3050127 RepID=UPI0035A6A65B